MRRARSVVVAAVAALSLLGAGALAFGILEAAYPVMFTRWALRPDSGGAGRHRGGLGAIYEIELLEGFVPRAG